MAPSSKINMSPFVFVMSVWLLLYKTQYSIGFDLKYMFSNFIKIPY